MHTLLFTEKEGAFDSSPLVQMGGGDTYIMSEVGIDDGRRSYVGMVVSPVCTSMCIYTRHDRHVRPCVCVCV
jgi:hypothetical protein